MKNALQKIVSVVLAANLFFSGCASTTQNDDLGRDRIKLNETISADSKWINSDIVGAIDADTKTNLKDDFYTYVNKDYILEQGAKLSEDDDSRLNLNVKGKIISERLKNIIFDREDPLAKKENTIGYNQAEIDYDAKLLIDFTKVAGDWDARKKIGTKPLEEQLARIDEISSMDEMTDYMMSPFVDNFSGIQLVSITNSQTLSDTKNYHVCIDLYDDYFFLKDSYFKRGYVVSGVNALSKEFAKDVLTKIGYPKKEINRMLKNTSYIEGKLADAGLGMSVDDYKHDSFYSMDDLKKMYGNYPVEQLIKANGFENSEGYCVYHSESAKTISKLYKESNLEKLKDFYRIHTLFAMAPLLDRELFDKYSELTEGKTIDTKDDGDTQDMESGDKELDILLNKFTYVYMKEPIDAVYVSRYCSAEEKEALTDLVYQIEDCYSDMIDSEDWLSKEAKQATKEKLKAMKLNILYPDSYPNYYDVVFTAEDTLPDMVSKLNLNKLNQEKLKVGKKVEEQFSEMSTTTINAYYNCLDNSVNILAGIVGVEGMFDLDDPIEVRLANLGFIVGHEISHGFDKTGVNYDKDGMEKSWWPVKDSAAFSTRASKLSDYYSSITPIPGEKMYNGKFVSNEAIADLGGAKCMLEISHDIDNFDYDLFFKSYAKLWAKVCSYDSELMSVQGDSHPFSMIRVNAVVQQFDEFYDTYGIEKGDGMYLSPKKRICVW